MMHSVTGFGALALVVILLWMGVNIAHHNSLLNPFVLAIVIDMGRVPRIHSNTYIPYVTSLYEPMQIVYISVNPRWCQQTLHAV